MKEATLRYLRRKLGRPEPVVGPTTVELISRPLAFSSDVKVTSIELSSTSPFISLGDVKVTIMWEET